MISGHSQFGEMGLSAHEPAVSEPELQEEMEETFIKLCDLLEQYAPPWYPDPLHKKAESVLRKIGK